VKEYSIMAKALYKQILEQLIGKIESGEYKYGDKIPTEIELSEKYFVSRITSRRALNELADLGYVTRNRRTGTFVKYIPAKAEGLSSPVSSKINGIMVIGLILPFDTSNSDGQRCLEGVLNVANDNNCYTVVQNSLSNYRTEYQFIEKFISDNFNGIIYYPVNSESNFSLMAKLEADKYPIVTIDKHFADVDIPFVASDNVSGAAELTRHLVEQGHKKIAFFSDVPISSCSSLRDRFKGFISVLADYNINFNSHHLFEARQLLFDEDEMTFDSIYTKRINAYAKKAVYLRNEGVTAVQCSSDSTAIQLYEACKKAGIRIPEDLSICGFDGLPSGKEIKLTTTVQNFYQIGVYAARILLERIANPEIPSERVSVPVKFQKGETVKNLKLCSEDP
jgi:GntR family transcriptional regulator of arabinose operon